MPETLTPWFVLITSFVGALSAIGLASMFLWRRLLWPGFRGLVEDAVAPMQTSLAGVYAIVQRELTHNGGGSIKDQVAATSALAKATDEKLTARTRVIDRKLEVINAANEKQMQRIAMVEVQLSKLREAIGQAE